MANTIKIKAGSGTPTTSDITDKELAFDRSADKLYINDNGSIVDLSGSASLDTEAVQDIVGAMFSSNTETRITATYQDSDGTIDLVVDDLDTDTQLTTENVQDIVGAMFTSNTETRISASYQDGDGTIDLVVDDMTANDNTQLSTEQVQDIVGAMFSSNTETRISATYEDGDGTIDLVVDDMTANDNTQLSTEQVQDIVGAMFSSNTETRIAATYQDGDGTIDLVVDDMTANTQLTLKDEDNMASNSATAAASQQSIKAYVDAEVAGIVNSAPSALNTLDELAAALGDDANFATTTSTSLGNRLRVDTASQGLTGTQQANAITNLGITATKAELNYVDGVTSNIQTQLDATLDTAGTGIDISSTTISVDVSDFMSNGSNNRIVTATGTDAMNAEANLTFNGHLLTVSGDNANGINMDADGSTTSNSERIFFTGTSTSAIFQSGSVLSFRTGATAGSSSGTERMHIDTSGASVVGDLAVSGNSVLQYGLVVNEGSHDADFRVESNGQANMLKVDAGNNYVGIAAGTPYERLYVECEDTTSPGIVSNPAATNGAVAYAIGYGDANKDYLNTWGMAYSSGANVFGYGVKPKTDADEQFINSADNSNFTRGALYFDNELKFFNAGATTGTIDTAITMTERFKIDSSGNLTLSGTVDGRDIASDGSKLDGIASGATANTGDITAVVAGTNLTGGSNSGSATLNMATFSSNIAWNDGVNITVAGESSFDVSGSGVFQIWDSGAGAPFIMCDVGQRTEIGSAGSRGVLVHGEIEGSSLDISGNIDVDGTTNLDNTDIDGTLNVSGVFDVDDIHGRSNGTNRLVLDDDTNSAVANGVSLTGVNHVYLCPDETNNGTGEVRVITGTDNDLDSGTADAVAKITNAGEAHFKGDVVAFSSSPSDRQLKENISTIENGLDKVMKLRGVEFDWTATSRKGQHDIGLIAQEVEEVLPEVVSVKTLRVGEFGRDGDEKDFKTVNYEKMVGVLVEAVKELKAEIEELKK